MGEGRGRGELSNHEASVFAVHHAVKKSSQFYVHLKEFGSSYLEV